jgi:hypothetical protein
MKESIVEIPEDSGNLYRYGYDPSTKKTSYLGPVGDAPGISEEELMAFAPRSITDEVQLIMDESGNKSKSLAQHYVEWAKKMSRERIHISTEMLVDLMKASKKLPVDDAYYLAIHKRLDPEDQEIGETLFAAVMGMGTERVEASKRNIELIEDERYIRRTIRGEVSEAQMPDEAIRLMVNFQRKVNEKYMRPDGLTTRIESEDLVRWAKLGQHMTLMDAYVLSIHNYADEDDKEMLHNIWSAVFSGSATDSIRELGFLKGD